MRNTFNPFRRKAELERRNFSGKLEVFYMWKNTLLY